MKKRVLSAVLIMALILTFTIPAFAATYSDLNGHWAKEYMENLASKGYLSGYSDGTMKPNKNITACETLAILSRMYTLTDLETEMVHTDYESIVKENVSSTLSWAYKNIEICLAAGIITKDELKTIGLSSEIQKEKLSVFVVRALQLTSEAQKLENTKLTFADASKVSSNCVGSVAELNKLGIVNGDNSNNFSPQSSVTRAVVATIISRSLSYLTKNNISLAMDAYSGLTRKDGIISSVNGSSVFVTGFDGLTREYTVSSDSSIKVNNTAKALSSIYEGCYTKITLKNGVVLSLAIESDATVKWIQGSVSTLSLTTSTSAIYVKNLKTGAINSYSVSGTAAVTRDGSTVALSSVLSNDFVTLKYVNNTVTQITCVSNISSLTGTISDITFGTTVTMKIADSNNVQYSFTFDISDLPTIKRGDATITIDRLKAGNKITIKFDKYKATLITAEGAANTITGELTSSTTSSNGTTWIITSSGTSKTYTIDEGVSVFNGTTAISLSDIHIGDQVSIVVYDKTITEVYQLSSSSSSNKVTGTVLKVDTAGQLITILNSSQKLVYIKTNTVVSVVVASTGNTTYLSSIALNSKITVYGSYSDSKTFTAKSIIIE